MATKAGANKHGTQLESLVKFILEEQGYQFIERNKFTVAAGILEQKLYTTQLNICDSIYSIGDYKHRINADFTIYNPILKEKYLIIECKSQTSGGSVDEKYPYLNENIKKFPYKTIVILDGTHAKQGAKLWLKKQVGLNPNLIHVFVSFSEFREWAIKNLG